MFVQIIRGGTPDPAALYARIDHWVADLSPRVSGWLGTTSGVTPAGEFVACVRFESAAAAAHNSGSSEQHTWWEETRPLLTGEIDFQDYDDVATSRAGGTDRAGFVQVMLGVLSDYGCEHALDEPMPEPPDGRRPDVLGGYLGIDLEAGRFAQVVYFSSEAEAREQERQESAAGDDGLAERAKMVEAIDYLDLPHPRFDGP